MTMIALNLPMWWKEVRSQNLNGTMETVKQGAYFIIDYGSRHTYHKCKKLKLINCLFQPEVVNAALEIVFHWNELMRICMIRY